MYDLIIIGAGPAGLTAALYAGRAQLETLLLEKMVPGGRILMSETIENFPGFPGGISTHELIAKMQEQLRPLGIEAVSDEALAIDCKKKIVRLNSGEVQARAIIIAAGARPRKLGVEGEERLAGKGVSYCATCDGPLYKGKDVVVVGGGDAVAEEAIYLSRFARQVQIIHRRDQFRASALLQARLKKNEKMKFALSNLVKRINGASKVESVTVQDLKTSGEYDLPCDGVFIYIGYEPETEFLKNQLKTDEKGFIITDNNLSASERGIFACGDCCKKDFYQVITACADGAAAVDSVSKYLMG